MFTKAKGTDAVPSSSPTPTQSTTRSGVGKSGIRSAPSIISSDMTIKGSVQSDGEMQIDGTIEGDVTASALTIGQSGAIIGEVRAKNVTVRGKVVGSIRAMKVDLETGSRVEGDILHASLSIQSNAVFEGQVKHADDPLKQSSLPATKAAPVSDTQTTSTSQDAKPADSGAKATSSSVPVKTGFGSTSSTN